MSSDAKNRNLGLLQVSRWSLGRAMRRWPELSLVSCLSILKIGFDLLKPWPMVFLLDSVLKKEPMGPLAQRIFNLFPGEPSTSQLIGGAVLATILIFLASWALG